MTLTLTLLAAGWGYLLSALLVRPVSSLLAAGGLVRHNYRGRDIPSGAGLALLPGFLPAALLLALRGQGPLAIGFLAATWGMGAAGLVDDLMGEERGRRGWRAHLSALSQFRFTGGGRKLLLGGGFALAAALPTAPDPVLWIVGALAVGLGANTMNQLDLRPGRSWKAFLVVATAAALYGGQPATLTLAPALGAAAAVLGPELRENLMLGDTGSNILGGLFGYVLFISLPPAGLAGAVVLLAAGQVAMEFGSLSSLIRRVPWLRRLDDWGLDPSG